MGKLIVNADDFGFSRGVNLGIVEGFREGALILNTIYSAIKAVFRTS